jgi:hypothetical protein
MLTPGYAALAPLRKDASIWLYASQLARGADGPTTIYFKVAEIGPKLGMNSTAARLARRRSQQFHRLLACAVPSPGAVFLVPRREARIPNSSRAKVDGSMP